MRHHIYIQIVRQHWTTTVHQSNYCLAPTDHIKYAIAAGSCVWFTFTGKLMFVPIAQHETLTRDRIIYSVDVRTRAHR